MTLVQLMDVRLAQKPGFAGALHTTKTDVTADFCCESPHHQCQLAVGGCLYWSPINPLQVRRDASATVHFHNKCGISHSFSLLLFCAEEQYTAQRKVRARSVRAAPAQSGP
jgi:hypothetical protein